MTPAGAGTHFECDGFSPNAVARQACFDLLFCLRTSHCNSTTTPDNFVPCYCGALDDTTCIINSGDPTAACYGKYNAALSSLVVPGATNKVANLFGDPRSPIGIADNIVKCDVDGMCNTAATCGAF
jgi:hypothetical protein